MVSTRQSSNSSSNIGDGLGEMGRSRQQQPQAGTSSNPAVMSQIHLLDLPLEILQKILGYLDFNKVAHLRPVCHQMDRICSSILNSTFQKLQNQMQNRFQAIKAQMPRRESARRNHPLACESDIIETLHMRLTLLQMSFGKHIERKHCCFFPAEILDEVYRILHYIKVTPKLARPYKVTDELFDLSTMAMEYFKDIIEPTLPEIPYFGADFLDLGVSFSSSSSVNKFSLCLDSAPLSVGESKNRGVDSSPLRSSNEDHSLVLDPNLTVQSSPPQSNMVLRKRIRKIKQGMKRYNSQLSLMRRDLRNCKAKIAEQQKQIIEYSSRLDDNDKKNEETSRKFSTLLQELNKCKTELQYWRSKSPAIPICFGCGQSIPLPTEDLQALANQGVLSTAEVTADEEHDFVPIADTSVRSSMDSEVSETLGIQQQQQDQQQLIPHLQIQNSQQQESGSSQEVQPMAPPLLALPIKRKAAVTSQLEKPRRALKTRHAKRTKV